MPALLNYEKKLKESLMFGRPLIHIETCDYEWERRVVMQLVFSKEVRERYGDRQLYSWSPYLGYRNETVNKGISIEGESVSNRFVETLDNFLGLEGSDVLIIEDIAYYFDADYVGQEFISQLSSRLYTFYCKEDRKKAINHRASIILMCPKFAIPVNLQGYLYRLTPPFPDEDDIAHELGLDHIWKGDVTKDELEANNSSIICSISPSNEGIIYKYSRGFFKDKTEEICTEGYEDNRKKVLSAFKGMRIKAIQSLLSYTKDPYKIEGGDNMEFLLESKKRMVMDSGLLKLENVPTGYSKYVGDIDGLKKYTEEVKSIIENRAHYNESMSMPKGILLVGPPGCGKSETSKAIADILNVPLLSLDMGSLMSKWHGEQEHNFQNAIALAEAAQPCVLRIDELEKAFSGTGGDNPNNDQSGVRVLGFFLTWMQERTSVTGSKSLVYLVATANNLDELRPEFLRKGRWDEIFYLIYPSAEGMTKIIQSCLRKYKLSLRKEGKKSEATIIRKECDDFFKRHPTCKVSGAEIADAIERAYKRQFQKVYKETSTKNDSNDAESAKLRLELINIEDVIKFLEEFAKKNRNYELERKVREDLKNIQIEHQKQYRPLTAIQEEQIKDILRAKYSQKKIETLIQQEISNLRVSHYMNNSTTRFNESSVSQAVRDKYSESYIQKLIEDEYTDITMSFHINNEPNLDPKIVEMLSTTLREKYEDVQDYEEYYDSKGYISASKPRE